MSIVDRCIAPGGPDHLRPLGEVEFANGVAAMGASDEYGATRLCDGIVGYVELAHPRVEEAIDRALAIAGGRFKGVRQVANWDADPAVIAPAAAKPRHLLRDPALDRGLAILADRGLSFDTFAYHHQLGDVAALAERHPRLAIILDHLGAPLGIGRYAGSRDAVFAEWHEALARLAGHANVAVKIGGMGMRMFGFAFEERPAPPSSEELAEAWAPYALACLDRFGAERAMLEKQLPARQGELLVRDAVERVQAHLRGPLGRRTRRALCGNRAPPLPARHLITARTRAAHCPASGHRHANPSRQATRLAACRRHRERRPASPIWGGDRWQCNRAGSGVG